MKLYNLKNKHRQSKFSQHGHSRQLRDLLSGGSVDVPPEKKKLTIRKVMDASFMPVYGSVYCNICTKA